MGIGDNMLARVQEVDEAHNIVLTMKGVGLRKLKEGIMTQISVNNIQTLRGGNNSTVNMLKEASDCRIIVAENGRVWVDGGDDGVELVRSVIEMIQDSGHKVITENQIQEFIDKRRNA